MNRTTRRNFLSTAAAASSVITCGRSAPAFLQQAAASPSSNGRILVVVEMAGGNDGLNTVVPFTHEAYQKARPELRLSAADVLKIQDGLGFHPDMTGFSDLLQAGHLAVVQGVGYPNPNRSHFESMDIWHTCQRKDQSRTDGWLGRYLEVSGGTKSSDPAGLHLGADKQPFALMSRDVRVPSIRSLEDFRLNGNDSQKFRQAVRELSAARRDAGNDLLNFVQSSTSSAISASERIEQVGMQKKSATAYPDSQLAKKLQTVSKLITSGLGTSVYYVQIDGFDTHAEQANVHSVLLRSVSDAVSTFVNDMITARLADRVLCVCFSEFGRRVQENASGGTDHGTAGPMFLAGTQVQPGLIGRHPDLTDLEDGDVKHHTDFRQVYAAVLQNWLEVDSTNLLKGNFKPVDVVRTV